MRTSLAFDSRAAATLAVLVTLLAIPAGVAATTERFHRFEEVATANWRIVETISPTDRRGAVLGDLRTSRADSLAA